MAPDQRPPETLPDPWLFDSEALLKELDRCRELVLQIPITTPNATHFGIQNAVNAIWNLQRNLRYLLQLHSEGQQQWQRRADKALSKRQTQNPSRQAAAAR
jgi:hypothetical protein